MFSRRRRFGRVVIYGALRLATLLARLLSLRALRAVADAVAPIVLLGAGRRRRIADANLAAVFPELSPKERRGIVRRSVRNAMRTVLEMFKLPYLTAEQLREMLPAPPVHALREAVESGSGVLLITAHFGQWEWSAIRIAQELGREIAVVYRPPVHQGADRLFRQARASHGLRLVDRNAPLDMMRVLRAGGVLGVLPDQNVPEGGVQVDFMGRPAWTSEGPARLALTTGARVFAGFCIRRWDGTFEGIILPELEMVATDDRDADLHENTRRINAAIEQAIRRAPDNWMWLHDRWKTDAQRQATQARIIARRARAN